MVLSVDLKSLVQKQATVHWACNAWDAAYPDETPIRDVNTLTRTITPISLKEKVSRKHQYKSCQNIWCQTSVSIYLLPAPGCSCTTL